MKKKIRVKDLEQLKKIISREIEINGEKCNLNYIDVSNITDMSELFRSSCFNGDISEWNVSSVEDMGWLFLHLSLMGTFQNGMLVM